MTEDAVESDARPAERGLRRDDSTRTREQGFDDTAPAPSSSATARPPAPLQHRDPDRYDKLAEHGRGGLGRVYRARDKELGRDVAVKELIKRNEMAEQRFFREALITARLEHPGIVPIHEAGRWPDGTPFYAMKLVAGRPLKELMAAGTTLEDRLALLPNVAAVADAIAYAHDRRIIHRDLKPGNVIIGDFGETIVIDWGLAKVLGESDDPPSSSDEGVPSSDQELTTAGSVLGTPAYMAPEQARGEPVDRRADVYAIGMILYHLCTGTRDGGPRAMDRALANAIDSDLLAIIARATDAEPARRHPDARALALDLHAYLGGRRVRSRTYNVAELFAHWFRHNKRLLLAALVLITLSAAVVGWSLRAASVDRRDARAMSGREAQTRAAAATARQRADLAQVNALRGRDPTAAIALLRDQPASAERALLEAQLLGAGVATYATPVLARRLHAVVPAHDLARIAFVSEARVLGVVDVGAGTITEPARDATATGPLAWSDGGWLFAAATPSGPALRHTDRPDVIALPAAPRVIAARGGTALVLDTRGTLSLASPGEPPRRVLTNADAAAWHGDAVVACTRENALVRGLPGGVLKEVGPCDRRASADALVGAGDFLFVPLHDATVELWFGDEALRRKLPSGRAAARAAITAAGDVAVVDVDGNAYALTGPGSDLVGTGAVSVAADGTWMAWGFRDGRVAVRNGTDPAWTFQAHADTITTLSIAATVPRMLTGTADALRVWSLDRRPPPARLVAPCVPEQLARHPGRANVVAGRCPDGSALVVNLDDHTSRILATSLAATTPVIWHGDRVCWGTVEGVVFCGEAERATVDEVARHTTAIGALVSDGARLFFATPDGSIFRHTGPAATDMLGKLDAEPTALQLTTPTQLVATTRNGRIAFIELSGGTIDLQVAHQDVAAQVATSETGDVFVASWDGSVSRWRERAFRTRHTSVGPVRDVRAVSTGFAAVEGSSGLRVEAAELSLAVPLTSAIGALATNRTYAAFGTASGEVVVVDVMGRRIASVPLPDPIVAIAALDDERFAAVTVRGAFHVVETKRAAFVNLP